MDPTNLRISINNQYRSESLSNFKLAYYQASINLLHLLPQFDQYLIKARIDFGSQINIILPNFERKIDFHIWKIIIGV